MGMGGVAMQDLIPFAITSHGVQRDPDALVSMATLLVPVASRWEEKSGGGECP